MNAHAPKNEAVFTDVFDGHSDTGSIAPRALSPPLPPGLRDAVTADRPGLLALWVLAWQAAMPAIDFEARRPWLDEHLDGLLAAGARLLVAEADRAPAGFVTVDPARRHLDQLAVHPAQGGRGLADRLMAGAKALSPDGLWLEVNAGNGRARRFYARHGFAPVGTGINARSRLPTLLLLWRHGRRVSVPLSCCPPSGNI